MNRKLGLSLVLSLNFCLLIVFLIKGAISSGTGLGDLFYLVFLFFIFVVSVVCSILLSNKVRAQKNHTFFNLYLIIGSVVLFYLIYAFSCGRGSELPWDGNFFV